MAGFCVSCGAPMTGAFCNKCGARAQGPGAQPQPSAPTTTQPPVQAVAPPSAPAPIQSATQPVTAATKGSGLGKVLLIVGGVFAVLLVIGVAGAVYGVYWVKHKVSNYASAVTGGGSNDSVKVVESGSSCRLLSTAELQEILGVPVERSAEIMDNDTPGCAYYTNQAAFKQLQRQAAELAKKQADEVNSRPGPKPDNLPALMKNANELEGVVKALGLTQPVEGGQVFSFSLQRNADSNAWAGARLVQAAVPGFEEVPGVGDRAMIGSFGHAFYAQKGDAMLYLNTIWVPDARARGVAISQKIFGHL